MLSKYQPARAQIRVLVVDDEPVNAQVLAEILEDEGYQTIVATGGQEALDKVATEQPSIVLLDVMMPNMDGFEVCRRIKSSHKTFFVPVVLLTALGAVEYRVKGAEAGADDFITKPPDLQELLTRVDSLARVRSLYEALEASNEKLKTALAERTQQLDEATEELRTLLAEKADFRLALTPVTDQGLWESVDELSSPTAPDVADHSNDKPDQDREALLGFKRRLMSRLSDTVEGRTDLSHTPEMVSLLGDRLAAVYKASGLQLGASTREKLFREVIDDILGYGPIEPLLADPSITEVMVNGPNLVYAEHNGRLRKTKVRFDDDDHVMRVIDRIIRPLGRRVDRKLPMVDARLPDGSRVNAIIAPCALDGPTVTIRKFGKDQLTVGDLIGFGSITAEMAQFLEACVRSRVNIVVSGGTGSGKTTLLNVLSSFIPSEERIVTIEDSAELQLHQQHVVRMEAKPADVDGTGEVTIRQLVKNALRMRPDRVIVGEVRSGEALDMLQAMNTGHDGSLTTIHANSPRDTIARMETLVLMAGMELPLKVVRAQITSAVDLIVQQARLRDGSRKVTGISEVQGMEGDIAVLSDIFAFDEKGMQDGKVVGELVPVGVRPKFTEKLEVHGYDLPPEVFMRPSQMEQLSTARRR
jgi:pilus assembly protein CpaF